MVGNLHYRIHINYANQAALYWLKLWITNQCYALHTGVSPAVLLGPRKNCQQIRPFFSGRFDERVEQSGCKPYFRLSAF